MHLEPQQNHYKATNRTQNSRHCTVCSKEMKGFAVLAVIIGTCLCDPWMPYEDARIEKTGRGSTELSKALGTPAPPCCSDTISSIACKRIQASNPTKFIERCTHDADFSMIQCCNTCGLENAAERYFGLFRQENEYLGKSNEEKSSECFDRHGTDFCQKFLKRQDVWGKTQWSCDGQFASLAFRICRKTCNYCRSNIYENPLGRFIPTPCGRPTELVSRD